MRLSLRLVAALAIISIPVATGCTRVRPLPEGENLALSGSRPMVSAAVVTPIPLTSEGSASAPPSPSGAEQVASSTQAPQEQGMPIAEATQPAAPMPTPTPAYRTHVVVWGDTLLSIALQYGARMEEIAAANNLKDNVIYVGQELKIPLRQVPPGAQQYIVQPGDTLYGIATKFGIDLDVLLSANGLTNGYFLQVGQVLVIPASSNRDPLSPGSVQAASAPRRTHVVQPGDTLWGIAMLYNVAPAELAAANGLANPNVLQVGQELVIP